MSVALLYSCVSGVLASRTRCQQFHGCGGYLPGAGRPLDWMMYSTYPVTFVTLYNFTFAYNKKGFQDICTFNLAMLARQSWRHVQNKESVLWRHVQNKESAVGFWEQRLLLSRACHIHGEVY